MKRLQILAGTALVGASLALASAAPPDEPADAFVYDAITAPTKVSYAGTVEIVNIGDNQTQASVYRIEHRAPDLTQRLYMSPPSLHGDLVVSQGDRSYFVDVRRHRVVRTENDASNDQIARDDNYLLLRANYRAVKQPAESFDGRQVRAVALINKFTSRTTMVVRIDEQTKLVLDKQQFASDGSLISETRFQEVRYSGDLPAADFSVPKAYPLVSGPTFGDPSKDVPAVARTVGFAAQVPKVFPGGFSPVEGQAIAVKGVRTLQILYSDGIRTISLFENAAGPGLDLQHMNPRKISVASRPALYAERGQTTLLIWDDGAIHYSLVADLPIAELQKIAESVAS
ncbi:MAG TPA: DUF4367 domain-containing protein [Candidatus Tumulicola sp.]|jgi:negative regulator of sigma E activity